MPGNAIFFMAALYLLYLRATAISHVVYPASRIRSYFEFICRLFVIWQRDRMKRFSSMNMKNIAYPGIGGVKSRFREVNLRGIKWLK
jgi:hypothetical protein